MAEITIHAPIECTWVGDDLFGNEGDHRQHVGRAGYWLDSWMQTDGTDRIVHKRDRRPIWVLCPGWLRDGVLVGTPFCIDAKSSVKNEPWNVTVDVDSLVFGRKPDITVSPSIHLVGIWHGWLEHGVLHQ